MSALQKTFPSSSFSCLGFFTNQFGHQTNEGITARGDQFNAFCFLFFCRILLFVFQTVECNNNNSVGNFRT
jgi:glutathione peroxidase-family protein